MAEYDTLDVARFMIRTGIELDDPIQLLKLDRLMYYAWVEYYKSTGEYLFRDRFCTGRNSLLHPKVHREFGIWAGVPIFRCPEEPQGIDDDTAAFLREFVAVHRGICNHGLGPMNLRGGDLWEKRYKDADNRTPVPFKDIIKAECGTP